MLDEVRFAAAETADPVVVRGLGLLGPFIRYADMDRLFMGHDFLPYQSPATERRNIITGLLRGSLKENRFWTQLPSLPDSGFRGIHYPQAFADLINSHDIEISEGFEHGTLSLPMHFRIASAVAHRKKIFMDDSGCRTLAQMPDPRSTMVARVVIPKEGLGAFKPFVNWVDAHNWSKIKDLLPGGQDMTSEQLFAIRWMLRRIVHTESYSTVKPVHSMRDTEYGGLQRDYAQAYDQLEEEGHIRTSHLGRHMTPSLSLLFKISAAVARYKKIRVPDPPELKTSPETPIVRSWSGSAKYFADRFYKARAALNPRRNARCLPRLRQIIARGLR